MKRDSYLGWSDCPQLVGSRIPIIELCGRTHIVAIKMLSGSSSYQIVESHSVISRYHIDHIHNIVGVSVYFLLLQLARDRSFRKAKSYSEYARLETSKIINYQSLQIYGANVTGTNEPRLKAPVTST
jgi:hypothetical protein